MNQPKHLAISCLSSPLSSASNFRTSLSTSLESERYLLVARKSSIGPKRLNQLWQSESWGGNQLLWILLLHFTSSSEWTQTLCREQSTQEIWWKSSVRMWCKDARSEALHCANEVKAYNAKWWRKLASTSTLVVLRPLAFWRSSENVLRQTRTCISVLVGVCMFNFVKLVFSQKASWNINWWLNHNRHHMGQFL